MLLVIVTRQAKSVHTKKSLACYRFRTVGPLIHTPSKTSQPPSKPPQPPMTIRSWSYTCTRCYSKLKHVLPTWIIQSLCLWVLRGTWILNPHGWLAPLLLIITRRSTLNKLLVFDRVRMYSYAFVHPMKFKVFWVILLGIGWVYLVLAYFIRNEHLANIDNNKYWEACGLKTMHGFDVCSTASLQCRGPWVHK